MEMEEDVIKEAAIHRLLKDSKKREALGRLFHAFTVVSTTALVSTVIMYSARDQDGAIIVALTLISMLPFFTGLYFFEEGG